MTLDHGGSKSHEYFPDAGNVAILNIDGVIMESESTLEKLRELEDREDIKAIVVRIDSPGGAVGPSQEVHDALLRLRSDKKIICSFGDLAASGGYYIASACEKIVANPGTLTGSIGVIMHFMNFKDLYSWAKVSPVTLKAGRYKDVGSDSRAMTDEERTLMQAMLDQVHAQFKLAVQEGRHLSKEIVDHYADGRIFSGEEARKLGFVDELGGEFESVELAAEMAGILDSYEIVRETKEPKGWRGFFDSESRARQRYTASAPSDSGTLGSIVTALTSSGDGSGFRLASGVPYLLPAHMFSQGQAR